MRSCGTRHATSVQNVLRIWGHSGDVFAPYVSLGGPLSVLLARGRWATLALDRAAPAHGHRDWRPQGARLDGHPPAPMLNSLNFVERFLVERAQAGAEDVAEAAGHLRCQVTDSHQINYVLKDADRHRRTWTGKAVFELSLLACGHNALKRNNDSNDTLAKSMSATSKLGEARLAATKWRRGGSVLPAHPCACNWATQLLDISFKLAAVLWAVASKCKMDHAHAWTTDVSTELMFKDFHGTSLRDLFPRIFAVSDLSCDVGGGGDDDDKASQSSSDLGAGVGVFGGPRR